VQEEAAHECHNFATSLRSPSLGRGSEGQKLREGRGKNLPLKRSESDLVQEAQEAQEARLHSVPDNPTARHEVRSSARRRSVVKWQDRWDRSIKVRWTHRLIPDIKSWTSRKHGERQALEEAVGTAISVDNLVSTMLVSQVAWDATAMFVASVLKTLRTLENGRRTRAE
ncbi:hypothetical protein KR059_009033, partial [Drosophila kikkawai]